MENKYLVYKLINGKLTSEIQYGEHTTGTDAKKDGKELERYKILDHNKYPISVYQKMYPFKGKLNEKATTD